MPFLPVVSIALPPTSPPTEVQLLVEACERAFDRGECVQELAVPEEGVLRAQIRWDNDRTRATVSVAPPATAPTTQQLLFQVADDAAQRSLALGYAVGSIAHALVQQQQQTEAALASAAESSSAAVEQALSSPAVNEPAEELPLASALDYKVFQPAPVADSAVELAALLGSALKTTRFGAALRGWITLGSDWVGATQFSYTRLSGVEVSTGGEVQELDGDFIHGALQFGRRLRTPSWELSLLAYVELARVDLASRPAGREASLLSPGAGLYGQARWATGAIEPFLAVQAGYGQGANVTLREEQTGDGLQELGVGAFAGVTIPLQTRPMSDSER